MNRNLGTPEHRGILAHFPNVAYRVVGIAASQGGLAALRTILSSLPPNFPAAIVVVVHISPQFPSRLSEILSRFTPLPVQPATAGAWLRPGAVYTAVPDQHVLVTPGGTLSLSHSAKINFARPAADRLFWSLSDSYRSRAIAVVLTGRNSDGALGVLAIKRQGGTVIAQDEATSEYFTMPQAAIATGKVDHVLPLSAIAPALVSCVMTGKAA